MSDALNYVREVSKAIGLKLPEDRVEIVSQAVTEAFSQVEEIRIEQNSHPQPTAFDSTWSEKK